MGCAGCLRGLLIAFNLVFLLIGGAALGIGIWVTVDSSGMMTYLGKLTSVSASIDSAVSTYNIKSLIAGASYLFLAAGGAIFLIAFLGCCGAMKKIKCLLVLYSIFIGIIILAEVAVIVVAYVFTSTLDSLLLPYMKDQLQKTYNSRLVAYGTNGGFNYSYANDETLAVDVIQLKFGCCGVSNGSDYANATVWNRTVSGLSGTMVIPATCCKMTSATDFATVIKQAASGNLTLLNSTCPITTYESNFNTGCYEAFKSELKQNSTLVIGISAGILGFQMLLIIFACCVCKSIDSDSKVSV